MIPGWQQLVTLLLVTAAVVYLTRHIRRSWSTAPGAGCGVHTGCSGCEVRTDRCITPVCPPALIAAPGPPKSIKTN